MFDRKAIFILFILIKTANLYANDVPVKLSYTISFPSPETHYILVDLNIENNKNKALSVKLPVWTPGSYLVREFARHVESVTIDNNLTIKKTNKNTWEINTNGKSNFKISYRIYANELSVRTSFVNTDHAYINNANVLMYHQSSVNTVHELIINKPSQWKTISTALSNNGNKYTASSYDELVDSPIEIGNHNVFTFDAAGVKHTVAMYGKGNYNEAVLVKDMAMICEKAAQVIGEHPCKNYTFIIHNLTNPSGGLEHLNSTTLQVNRFTYEPFSNYKQFLALVAHEYFHLWNVKRIRPIALGPFNYDEENYTNMLWLSEGFTSYYEEIILNRAGFTSKDDYIKYISGTISGVENSPGVRVQSASESSFDAWIKGYRPHENSNNTTISYYGRGEVIAASLDLLIIKNTSATKCLDDVMKYLYTKYYKELNRGFTDDEFKKAVALIAGTNVDDFFTKYIYGTEHIDYNTYMSAAGLQLVIKPNAPDKPYLGATIQDAGGKLVVNSVTRNSTSYLGGLNSGDEIIAIDDYRVNTDKFNKYFSSKNVGDNVIITISRDDIIKKLEMKIIGGVFNTYLVDKLTNTSPEQNKNLSKWLN